MIEYTTPQNILAEQAVISACMIDQNAMSKALQYIGDRPEYFYDINHRAYWRAMTRIYKRGQQVDAILLVAECELEKESWIRPFRVDIVKISITVLERADHQAAVVHGNGSGRPPTVPTPVVWYIPFRCVQFVAIEFVLPRKFPNLAVGGSWESSVGFCGVRSGGG